MGSPEIPEDGDNYFGDEQNSNLPMHGVNFVTTSDESDGENINNNNNNNNINDAYVGYQPLSMIGDNDEGFDDDALEDDDEDDHNNLQENINPASRMNIIENDIVAAPANNTPPDADAEIEAEIWSGPRPQVLSFELDSDKTQQIITAMSKITLPLMNVPDWANNITEEKWKEDLLHRIRQRQQEPSVNNNNNNNNDDGKECKS